MSRMNGKKTRTHSLGKIPFAGIELTSQRVRGYMDTSELPGQPALVHHDNTRFKAVKGIMDALVHLRKKMGARGQGEANAGESVLATLLWGMLYADHARVVSQSPDRVAEEDDGGDCGRMRGV